MPVDWSNLRPAASSLGFGQHQCTLVSNFLETTLPWAWQPGQGSWLLRAATLLQVRFKSVSLQSVV